MNINELYHIQKELDRKILKEHQLEGRDLISEKILALQVELGELANETRCFKYWSKKGPSEKSIILEEYVDCLHFILSIGLEKQYTSDINEVKSDEEVIATHQFLKVYSHLSNFQQNNSKENYLALWQSFIVLGKALGFRWDEITTAYLKKNEINHQRQKEGY
ncbi:dUTP diphosphatase [Alkaliphilus transvaalensis]|uniref:dUTP diphosphatase n=1 Tax=Alkaliphilus transvaalensis TaxID=114628 RepID=UPI00047E8726|nr:dUTP diphosphatase [Alkaliphilus transvaalensis]